MALLTQRQIQNINISRSAISGRIYHGTDGKTYQGQSNKTLLEYQPAVTSSFIPTALNPEVTVQKAIENVSQAANDITDATLPFSDITTNNSSLIKHGFLPKLSGVSGQFMDGVGVWAVPAGTGVTSVGISGSDFTIGSSPITTSGTITMSIAPGVVTYAKIQNVTTNKLLGRATSGVGSMEEIILGTGLSFTGTTLNASSTSTLSTIVDDVATNAVMYPIWVTANAGNLPLKVSSTKLNFNPSTGILTSTGYIGSALTSLSTIGITAASNGAGVGNGVTITSGAGTSFAGAITLQGGNGTAGQGGGIYLSTGTSTNGAGGSIYAYATNGVGTDKDGGSFNITLGNKTGTGTEGRVIVTPRSGALTGSLDFSLLSTTNKVWMFPNTTGTISLTSDIIGIANGGTGQITANAGFNALSPMTTGGDIIYGGIAGLATSLANGSAGQVLTSSGTTLAPVWSTPSAVSATSTIVNDTTTNATMYLTWVTANTGNLPLYVSSTKLSFNPSTGLLASTGFLGPLIGNVTGNVSGTSSTFTGNLTGDITSSGMATTLATVNANVGTFGSATKTVTLTTNGKGLITAISENTITTNAATVTVADAAGDTTTFLMLAGSATGNLPVLTDAGLTYNATTDALSTTTFIGALTGNASTATALQNARTIGGVTFDGTANIVPQTIQSVNEVTDTTCFPLFISASGSQSLQPLNNAGLIYNSNTNALTATTFLGALNGNATTATSSTSSTNATNVGVTDDITTNATMYLSWFTAATGNLPNKVSSTKLTFNPSTGNLSSTNFVGTFAGNTITTGTGILTMSSAKTLTVSDSTTLATNSITLAGGEVITFTASNALTLTTTGTTNATFPLGTNTLYSTLANSITSAQILSSVTDETGTGVLVFGTAPTFTTGMTIVPGTDNGIVVRESDNGFNAIVLLSNATNGYVQIKSGGVTRINLDALSGNGCYILNNVGIGTASPTNNLSFAGNTDQTIWMERNTAAATIGRQFIIQAGGATSGTANNGGALRLKSGTSVGTGTGDIEFYTSTPSSGTTDNDPTLKMMLKGIGNMGLGTLAGSTISALLHLSGITEQLRIGYDASNYYKTTVGSTGIVTFDAVGSGSSFVFSDAVTLPDLSVAITQAAGDSSTKIATTAFVTTGMTNSMKDVKSVTIDGQGAVITTGVVGGVMVIPYNGTITGWTIYSTNRAGLVTSTTTVLDAWKVAYASFPPTVTNTIFSGNKPTLTAASKNSNTSMSVAVTAGDVIMWNVDSNNNGLLINCSLNITIS